MLNPIKPSKLILAKEFENQLNEFLSQGNEVKMLETTELKPHRFIVNSKIVQPIDKLPPIHKR